MGSRVEKYKQYRESSSSVNAASKESQNNTFSTRKISGTYSGFQTSSISYDEFTDQTKKAEDERIAEEKKEKVNAIFKFSMIGIATVTAIVIIVMLAIFLF